MSNNQDEVALMLSLQDGVNSIIDSNWRERGNAWYRAVWLECAEMMEREGNWKWWKAARPPEPNDKEQQQIELVDIWHFILSWALEQNIGAAELAGQLGGQPPAAADRHQLIEAMVRHASCHELPPLVGAFAQCCREYELPFDRLFTLYVGKNVVNRFRQDRGYKDGSYQKVFAGKEDNEHLSDILGELNDVMSVNLPDALYDRLAARYDAALKR